MRDQKLSLLLLAITTLYFSGFIKSVKSNVCNDNGPDESYVGLRPDLNNRDPEACEKFWHCRKSGSDLRNMRNPAAYEFFNGVLSMVPVATSYRCSDWNSSRPYFSAETCECVETDEHCEDNEYFQDNCSRGPLNVNTVEVEPCRHWGPNGTYYLGLFPDYDYPSKFWHCAHNAVGEKEIVKAAPKFCAGSQGINAPKVYYSQEVCLCLSVDNNVDDEDIEQSKHPMFRENCVEEYVPEP